VPTKFDDLKDSYFQLLRYYFPSTVPGEHAHQVLPAAMKHALRYHVQTMCGTVHCVDALVLYLNSPSKTDGTLLLWDVDGDGLVGASHAAPCREVP